MYLIPLLKNRVIALKENDNLRNGLLFSAFSFINKGFSFFLVLILVNFVSPADYGLLNLFGTVVMVIGYVMALSTDNYLSVAYFNDGEIGVKNTVSGVAFITIIVLTIRNLMKYKNIDITKILSFILLCSFIMMNFEARQEKIGLYIILIICYHIHSLIEIQKNN